MKESKALTTLDDDERQFQEMVRDFAEEKVRPRVEHMDHEGKLDPRLMREVFDLGIMGIEIPEAYGGAEATFFMSVLVVEELARVDPSLAVLVDVQNTLVNNCILRWANDEQRARYFPKLTTDWGTPSSETWRSAWVRPGMGFPFLSVTTMSTVPLPAGAVRTDEPATALAVRLLDEAGDVDRSIATDCHRRRVHAGDSRSARQSKSSGAARVRGGTRHGRADGLCFQDHAQLEGRGG
jgi:hypothetical protein